MNAVSFFCIIIMPEAGIFAGKVNCSTCAYRQMLALHNYS